MGPVHGCTTCISIGVWQLCHEALNDGYGTPDGTRDKNRMSGETDWLTDRLTTMHTLCFALPCNSIMRINVSCLHAQIIDFFYCYRVVMKRFSLSRFLKHLSKPYRKKNIKAWRRAEARKFFLLSMTWIHELVKRLSESKNNWGG